MPSVQFLDMDEIGLEKARDVLGEIVDKAALAGEHYTITRHGKPRAVLVGYDWYARTVPVPVLEALASKWHEQSCRGADMGPAEGTARDTLAECARMLRKAMEMTGS